MAGIRPGAVPLVYSDFKNADYRKSGVACTLADLWENNENWSSGYDAGDVVAGVGLRAQIVSNGGNQDIYVDPKMVDAAAAPLLSGFVAIYDFTVSGWDDGGDYYLVCALDLIDFPGKVYNLEQSIYLQSGGNTVRVFYQPPVSSEDGVRTIEDGAHRVATSLTADEVAVSIDGTATVSEGTYTVAGAMGAVALYINMQDYGAASGTFTFTLEKIVFYDPADYTVGSLPGLSAL